MPVICAGCEKKGTKTIKVALDWYTVKETQVPKGIISHGMCDNCFTEQNLKLDMEEANEKRMR